VNEITASFKFFLPSNVVGYDGIPFFFFFFCILKGRSQTFVPVVSPYFNISLASQTKASLWKGFVVISIYKKTIDSLSVIIGLFLYLINPQKFCNFPFIIAYLIIFQK